MGIDVTSHICELLYEHESVIIPGLGCVVATSQTASFDHVQGLLHPPSKKLSFNENLLINDGLLVDYIKQRNDISLKESVDVVNRFVQKTKGKLNNKEIVILPQIGRLYKDYENSLRFLQDATNFNTEVYGLPTLQYYPILRSQEPPVLKKNKPVQLVEKKRSIGLGNSLSRKIASVFLPLFIGLMVIVFTIGFYKKQQGTMPEEIVVHKLPVNETRINQKPSLDNLSFFDGISVNGQNGSENNDVEINRDKEPVLERPVFPDQEKECVIIIGVFSQKAGIEKRVKDIYNFGYDAYQDKRGALTRVGVRFGYEKDNEIKTMLKIVRKKFDSRAWVLEE